MDAATTAVVVALISLLGTGFSLAWQRRTAREEREEERRSAAKVVLDRYRGPLLHAASDLGARLHNIRRKSFGHAGPDDEHALQARLTTAFRFAQFFGWREVLRTEVQLLRFDDDAETRLVSSQLNDVRWVLATDRLDLSELILWVEEQRGIGELMLEREDGGPRTLGYARFAREYEERFKRWIDQAAGAALSPAARASDRLRLLQWTVAALVGQLDEERAYESAEWIEESRQEYIDALPPVAGGVEAQLWKGLEMVWGPGPRSQA